MVQTRSDAPVNTGSAPAIVSAADIAPVSADTSGDSTTLKDAIGGNALGAGNNKTDLESVRALNGKSDGTADNLGLPTIELHDPLAGGDEIGAGTGGGNNGGTDGTPTRGDSGTADGATDGEPGTDAPAQPDTAAGELTTRGQNPRDASPFKKDVPPAAPDVKDGVELNNPEMRGAWDNIAKANMQRGTNHNVSASETSMIQQQAKINGGGTSGIPSVGSDGAASVVRNAADAAHHHNQNHHNNHHQRQGLLQRMRDRRHR